jgi:hypothetical protein
VARFSKRQKISIISLVFYWPMLFVLGHIPIPQVVRRANVSDKSLHFLAYMLLAFMMWSAAKPPDTKVNWRRLTPWWVLLVAAAYGVCDEWLQFYVAGRSTDMMDLAADFVGALASLVLLWLASFWPALLILTAVAIFSLTNFTRADLSRLLPAVDTIFHLAGYGFFTAAWLRYTTVVLSPRRTRSGRLLTALALPFGLLVAVKLGSVLFGRNVHESDIVLAAAAIIAILVVHSFVTWLCNRTGKTSSAD